MSRGLLVKIFNEDRQFVGEDLVIKTNIEVTTSNDDKDPVVEDDEQSEAVLNIKSENPFSNGNDIFNTYNIETEVNGNTEHRTESAPLDNIFQLLPSEPVEVVPEIVNDPLRPKRTRVSRKGNNPKDVPRDAEGNFLCQLCDYKAKQMGHLTAHISSKHIGLEFNCDLCDFKTRWKNRLNSHKRSIHKEEGGFPCAFCPYLACEKYVLAQHLKQVHGGKEEQKDKSYACEHCNYKAYQKSHIRAHVEAIHHQITYVCDLCGFQTKWRNRLKTHTNSKHKMLFISCDHCSFKTCEKFLLKQHILKKHGDIKFTCFICDAKLSSRLELNKHTENVHQVKIM